LLDGAGFHAWLLREPARYLVTGWEDAEPYTESPGLAEALRDYTRLFDAEFIEKLEDGDHSALQRLLKLKDRVDLIPGSPQQAALSTAVANVLETYR